MFSHSKIEVNVSCNKLEAAFVSPVAVPVDWVRYGRANSVPGFTEVGQAQTESSVANIEETNVGEVLEGMSVSDTKSDELTKNAAMA